MKITLTFPPTVYQTKQTMPPLGIAWIAAVLRENGYKDINLIDAVINNFSNEDIIDLLKKQSPDIVGVSFGTETRFTAFELIKIIKENFPGIIIVAGGPHPTLTADDTLRHIKEIDYVVRGEGEYSFLELVKAIDNKEKLTHTKGISYREGENVVHNSAREPIINLDELPFPARDLLPIDKYKQTIPLSNKICTTVMSARGCPYQCIYCSTSKQWGHSIRHRSADSVIKEIKHVLDNYKLDGVGFFDDVFTMNKQRVIEFCKKVIEKKINIYWWCEARANTIDKEMVKWMKKAGCIYISMAVESGSNRILKIIKKAITVEMAIEAAKIIKSEGIKLKLFFMHGLPDESLEEIRDTVYLSRWLRHQYGVDEATQGFTRIYPGTEVEQIAKEREIIPKDFSWSEHFYEPRNYSPMDISQYVPIFEQPHLTYEDAFRTVRKAKITYFLKHPHYFLKDFYKYRNSIKKWMTTKLRDN